MLSRVPTAISRRTHDSVFETEHRGCHSRSLRTHLVSASLLAAGLAAAARAEELPVQRIFQGGGEVSTAAMSGGRLYLGIGPRLVIQDASDPANPVYLGQSEILPNQPSTITDIAVSGNYAYVLLSGTGLQVVDVSSPAIPVCLGFCPLEGTLRRSPSPDVLHTLTISAACESWTFRTRLIRSNSDMRYAAPVDLPHGCFRKSRLRG